MPRRVVEADVEIPVFESEEGRFLFYFKGLSTLLSFLTLTLLLSFHSTSSYSNQCSTTLGLRCEGRRARQEDRSSRLVMFATLRSAEQENVAPVGQRRL